MAGRHSSERSSLLVSLPVIVFSGLLCLLTAFYGKKTFSFYLMIIFLFSFISRCWAALSASKVDAHIGVSAYGVFPQESMEVELRVKNNKFLPIAWLDLYMPVPKSEALVPSENRIPDSWEKAGLSDLGASEDIVGSKRLGRMLWYEESVFFIHMDANRRGVCRFDSWRLFTGDGLGLSDSDIKLEKGIAVAVYPKIVDVDCRPFLKNLWNSSTGAKGVMEDMTVIRSTRDYQAGDGIKNINWRLLARALPLTVNIYEDILPKSIHLIFDGESFAKHPEELETALSVIASELLVLKEHEMRCILSLPLGKGGGASTVDDDIQEALFSMASYEPVGDEFDQEKGEMVPSISSFDLYSLSVSSSKAGHFFYFTYDAENMPQTGALDLIDGEKVTIVSFMNIPISGDWGHLFLSDLIKRGGR